MLYPRPLPAQLNPTRKHHDPERCGLSLSTSRSAARAERGLSNRLMPVKLRPTVVSLFSGCGGLDLGFKNSGYQLLFASDNDPAAVKVYSQNLGHKATELDVTMPRFQEVLRALPSPDVLLGGFPCQGFSKAGPKSAGDVRNTLYQAMIQALVELRPRVFLAENVDGIEQNFKGEFLNRIISDCTEAGYQVAFRTVDAAWFGVPQHRRRVFIVGVAKSAYTRSGGHIVWPEITHRPELRNGERKIHTDYPRWAPVLKEPVTIEQAFNALPSDDLDADNTVGATWSEKSKFIMSAIGPGQKLCNARHDSTSVRTWDIPEAFGHTTDQERELLELIARNRRHKVHGTIPNGNPLSIDTINALSAWPVTTEMLNTLVAKKYLKRVGQKWDIAGGMFASGIYKRPKIDQLAPTVLTNFHNPRYFVHPIHDRPFTIRETAALQSFPHKFKFLTSGVSAVDAYRLIGNAVPPRLAQKMAESILHLLDIIDMEACA